MTTLKNLAIELEKNLESFSHKDVKKLFTSLKNIINKAKNEEHIDPEENVPGSYWFIEG